MSDTLTGPAPTRKLSVPRGRRTITEARARSSRSVGLVGPTSRSSVSDVKAKYGFIWLNQHSFSELSVEEAISDPLIALLNEADGVSERAFAQLLQSASRVLAV